MSVYLDAGIHIYVLITLDHVTLERHTPFRLAAIEVNLIMHRLKCVEGVVKAR